MARITPKTNWVANDIPVANDLNRIENNNQQAFSEIDQEVSDRQAAITSEQNARQAAITTEQNARQAAITTEQNARISADNTLQNNINGKANNAVIGDNGGVGSIVMIASTSVQNPSIPSLRDHTWTMPHSGVWFLAVSNFYFSGNTYGISVSSAEGNSLNRTFWRIG